MSGTDLVKGRDLTIGEIRPDRPYLILNSINATAEDNQFGEQFTFTKQDFEKLDSDINDYSLARTVMASAAFPGAFNSMTLLDYNENNGDNRFVHVFDGGNVDNLGLMSVSRILDTLHVNNTRYDKLVVILVDAATEASGISQAQADPRRTLDFFIDTNVIDATDSLLARNRKNQLETFKEMFKNIEPSQSVFYHLKFSDIEDKTVRNRLNGIKTSFNIEPERQAAIDDAVQRLLIAENPCLMAIKQLLETGNHSGESICNYTH